MLSAGAVLIGVVFAVIDPSLWMESLGMMSALALPLLYTDPESVGR